MDIVNKKSYTTLRKMIQRRAIKFNLNLLNNLLNYFHDSINGKNYKIIKKTKIFFIAKLIFFSILLYLIIYIIPFHWIMFVSILKKKNIFLYSLICYIQQYWISSLIRFNRILLYTCATGENFDPRRRFYTKEFIKKRLACFWNSQQN